VLNVCHSFLSFPLKINGTPIGIPVSLTFREPYQCKRIVRRVAMPSSIHQACVNYLHKLPSKERRTHFGFLGDGIVSSSFFPFALADPRQSDEGQEGQHCEEDRLRGIDPEPCVRASFPDQPPLRIIWPYEGEEDQETNAVNHDAR
jgi:hypothetical protein